MRLMITIAHSAKLELSVVSRNSLTMRLFSHFGRFGSLETARS